MTEEQLQTIEQLAGLFYSPEKVAIMTEIDIDALKMPENPAYKAYWKGYYQSEAEFRTKVVALAKAGSSPAQTMTLKFIQDMREETT